MGIALVLNLLEFKTVEGDLMGLPISVPISSLMYSILNLIVSGLFAEAISRQYLEFYITVSHSDFKKINFLLNCMVSFYVLWFSDSGHKSSTKSFFKSRDFLIITQRVSLSKAYTHLQFQLCT